MTGRHSIEAALARFPGRYTIWTVYGWRRITYIPAALSNHQRIAEWATTAQQALNRAGALDHNRYSQPIRPLCATHSDETTNPHPRG